MELYIRTVNGRPFEHPIFGDNFRQAFPNVDVENLPFGFARFERVEAPEIGAYEIYEGVTYEWVDGVVKDVHYIRPMTAQERQSKIDMVRAAFTPPEAGWVFDEVTCAWVPPAENTNVAGSAPNVIG